MKRRRRLTKKELAAMQPDEATAKQIKTEMCESAKGAAWLEQRMKRLAWRK